MNDKEFREMLTWINIKLANGQSRDEITKQLLTKNSNPKNIEKIIDTAIEFQKNQYSDNSKTRVSSFIIAILSFIIMFAILNGVIYGAQEIYYWNDVKKCESIKNKLHKIKKRTKILELEKEIKQGILDNYTSYQNKINIYNSNSNTYKQYQKEYDNSVTEYNQMVTKYNTLSKTAYSRWWLIPIPLPGKHTGI